MPSSYSRSLGLELQVTGENPGTWGEITNTNLRLIDDAVDGSEVVTLGASGGQIVTDNAPVVSQGRAKVLTLTGPVSSDSAVVQIVPNDAEKWYFVRNETPKPLAFSQGSGSTYTVPAGYSAVIHCDGAGSIASVTGTLSSVCADKLLVRGPANITGAVDIGGALNVTGAATLASTLNVTGAVTLSGLLHAAGGARVDVGADAEGDLYYRSASGALARIPRGADNAYLRVDGVTIAWQAPELLLGTAMPGPLANSNGVLFSNAGVLSQAGSFTFLPADGSLYLGNALGNPSGHLHLYGGDGVTQDAVTTITLVHAGTTRWIFGAGTSSGGGTVNGVHNFVIFNPALGRSVLTIADNTGRVLVGNMTGDHGGTLTIEPNSNAEVPLVIRRRVSQASHLTIWQDEGGNPLAWVDADGGYHSGSGSAGGGIALQRSTQNNNTSNVNQGVLSFYSTSTGATPGGWLSFNYGASGGNGGVFFAVLPTGSSTTQTNGLTWSYRGGGAQPGAPLTFEQFMRESAEGILDNLLAHPDLVLRLKEALKDA